MELIQHKGGCKMKVSIESILGSAQKINSDRQFRKDSTTSQTGSAAQDGVSISQRVNSRLDLLETEFRGVQSSLTQNQIIRDGVTRLADDAARGGGESGEIMKSVTFEGAEVLRSFVGEETSPESLDLLSRKVNELIALDISALKRLQVETDNIMASNITGPDRAEGLLNNMESFAADLSRQNPGDFSSVNPEAVMRLIK
jgi:hypothetical protein